MIENGCSQLRSASRLSPINSTPSELALSSACEASFDNSPARNGRANVNC